MAEIKARSRSSSCPRSSQANNSTSRRWTTSAGNRRFRVRLHAGGSPALVADQKLTPLFEVDGKNAAQYVSDAYFQANPGRTPRTMQPGDEFVLTLPADAFLVRWQEEETIDLQGPTRVRDFVSDRGDRLRIYLDQRVPIEYALVAAESPDLASLRLSTDLAYLLGAGRLTPIGLARMVYQVPDPDLYQVMEMRRLAESVKPGQSTELTVDRTRTYLDPVREAMTHAPGDRAGARRGARPPEAGGVLS